MVYTFVLFKGLRQWRGFFLFFNPILFIFIKKNTMKTYFNDLSLYQRNDIILALLMVWQSDFISLLTICSDHNFKVCKTEKGNYELTSEANKQIEKAFIPKPIISDPNVVRFNDLELTEKTQIAGSECYQYFIDFDTMLDWLNLNNPTFIRRKYGAFLLTKETEVMFSEVGFGIGYGS